MLCLIKNSSVNAWEKVAYQIRGSYVEVSFPGDTQFYCIAKQADYMPYIIGGCVGGVLLLIVVLLFRRARKRRKRNLS